MNGAVHPWSAACVLTCLAAGCGREQAPLSPPEAPPSPPEAPLTEVEMVGLMEEHYRSAIAAHDAVIRGDPASAQARLADIANQPLSPRAPATWLPQHARLAAASRAAASATTREAAAGALARVAGACGGCHEAVGLREIYRRPEVPTGTTEAESAMLRHQWASERLWEGVTGPWDDAWLRGTRAFAETRLFVDRPGASERLRSLEDALRSAARAAELATGLAARAEAYGRVLARCADCHADPAAMRAARAPVAGSMTP